MVPAGGHQAQVFVGGRSSVVARHMHRRIEGKVRFRPVGVVGKDEERKPASHGRAQMGKGARIIARATGPVRALAFRVGNIVATPHMQRDSVLFGADRVEPAGILAIRRRDEFKILPDPVGEIGEIALGLEIAMQIDVVARIEDVGVEPETALADETR